MSYQNRYRDYLESKRPYQAYLDKPQESSSFLDKVIGYGAAATGLAVGGFLALKSGAFREPISFLIKQLGQYKEGYLPKAMKGISKWAEQDRFKLSENIKKYGYENSLNMILTGAFELPRFINKAQSKSSEFIFSSLESTIDDISRLEVSLKSKNHIQKDIDTTINEARENLYRDHGVTSTEQIERLKVMGYRQMTAREALETGHKDLFKHPEAIRNFVQSFDNYKKEMARKGVNLDYDIMIDKDIMINAEIGKAKDVVHDVSDMRVAHNVMNRFIHSAATDFGFPFVNINPLRMAYVDNIFKVDKVPFTHFLSGENYNPLLSNSIGKALNQKVGEDFVFINGNVYKAKLNDGQLEAVMKNTYLAASQEGPIARNMRIMSNITTARYSGPKKYGTLGKMLYAFSDTLGIGFSDGPNTKFSAFDPMSYIPGFANYIDRFKPWTKELEKNLKYSLSNKSDYIVMNKMKHLGKDNTGEVFKQWFAGRNDPNNITTATMAPYMFFQRIDASLSQVKLGLPISQQGSAADIFVNLLARRGLPIVAGIAAWDYLNFESDNLLSVDFNKGIATTYKNTSIGLAGVRDKLGITDWAKHKANIFQGGEQIAELPIIGRFFDLNDSEEETQKFWDSGMVPIRKGRWWPMGNCVHPDTTIQLANGRLTLAKNVNVGDMVLTHLGENHQVLQVLTRDMGDGEYTPEIYVHGFPESIITTDNHPYLLVKPHPCTGSSYQECRPNRVCNLKKPYKQCANRSDWNPKWTLARDIKVGDYLAYPRMKFNGKITEIDNILFNEDIGYLIGVFLAEGNIDKWVNGKGYSLQTIHNVLEQDIAEKLDAIIYKYFGVTGTISIKQGNALRYRICNRRLTKIIQDLLYVDREKGFIPNIQDYSLEFVIGVVKGIFEGDGHLSKCKEDSLQMSLTAKRMTHIIGIRNILFALGIKNTVGKHDYTGVLNSKDIIKSYTGYRLFVTGDDAKNLYKLTSYRKPCPTTLELTGVADKYSYIDDNYVYLKTKSINDSGYRGTVYDYEIEQAHSFCGLTVILHNTPYSGGKIDHWEPNWVRKTESDYKYTDVLWGSKDEYWENSIFPTPRHPLAPIEHLLTDPYHYEEKHKLDRPYLMTGGIPEINEIPIVGPLLGATLGQLLKPQRRMHLEIWNKLHEGTYSESEISPTPSDIIYQQKMVDMIPQGPGGVGGSGEGYSGQSGRQTYHGAFKGITATTPRTVRDNVGPSDNPYNKITIGNESDDLNSTYGEHIDTSEIASQVRTHAWEGIKEMGGMYGFAANTAAGGITADPVIADTRAITSMRRQFWDLQIGGFGDDVNEIGRRFTGNREKWEDAFNPVRNQMPSWMPGSSYFTDFKHGDPYIKIPNGEARLPGAGYEALWGLDNPMDMKIGASSIGGTKEEIVNHLLHLDDFNNDDMEEILNYGTKVHAKAERELTGAGVSLASEGYLKDKEMRISGIYDAIVDNQKFLEYYSQHGILNLGNLDQNVADGRAVMDFKTMSDKKYNQNQMFQKNQEQINFYMHASGIHRAYLVHLNRDKPELPPKVYGFDFDQKMLDQTVAKVNDARDYVKSMIDKGIVGPADMYDWIDRYRILSDVAPYSDELKTIKKLTRMTDLKPDQIEQIKEINEQTTAKKKPLRLYPYRFSNAKIDKQTVTVDRVIDNNTFFTKEYPDNPIRLAGVSVSNAKNNKIADAARDYLSRIIYPGASVRIGYDADSMNKIKDDTYHTIQSVVYKGMTNVNKTLINQGLGNEKVEDFSPAAVHARFRSDEISIGKAWEFLAHTDSPANCIAPWTDIITITGIKQAQDLIPGDMVLTHKGQFKPVVDVRPQPIGKHIVDLKLSSSNILLTATDDHPVLACKYIRKKRITSHSTGQKLEPYGSNPKVEFVNAGQLRPYDYVVYCPRKFPDDYVPVIDLLQLSPSRFIENDGHIYTTFRGNKPRTDLGLRYMTMTPKLARLLGYYAAEGCTSLSHGRLSYTIFTFHPDEQNYINDVVSLTQELFNIKVRIVHQSGSVHIVIGSVLMAELMSYYVGHKHEKHAPEILLTNKELRAEFIRGLFRGDATKAGCNRYDFLGMNAISLILWVRDALFDLWRIPGAVALAVERNHNLYGIRIGKYNQLAVFIDGENSYKPVSFVNGIKNCNRCAVGEYIFYRIKEVVESPYQEETIDIEVLDDDTFSTMNVAIHNTKFLQVRSARESYERRDLYGKNWQTWQHPVDDYLTPWYQNLISRNPLLATVSGALIGSLFGATMPKGKAPFGKLVGAMFGAVTVGGGSLYRATHDVMTGEKWVPERRHKEWNFNEYLDTLKYIKYESLYRQAADMALDKEGFNVDEYLSKQNTRLDFNKQFQQYLLQEKRKLYKADDSEAKQIMRAMNAEIKRRGNDAVISGNNKSEIMTSVNKAMADVQIKRKYIKIPPTTPIARDAIKYHQLSKQTMYGYEIGDPLTNLLVGLPKKDRDYLMPFINSPEADRKEILRETPLYVRRVLESMWGEKTVEEKPELEEYFKTHELPGSEWGGWRPDVNLDDVKVKIVKHEGMDESEFNIWEDDKHRAALLNPKISIPSPNKHTTPGKIKRVLEELLGNSGLHDVQVQVNPANGYKVDVDIARDRRQELEEYVNQNASLII